MDLIDEPQKHWRGDMNEERLAEIEARANAATAGPWTWEGNGFEDDPDDLKVNQGWQHQGPDLESPTDTVISSWGYDADGVIVHRANGLFIAAARSDVPALVAEVRRLQQVVHMLGLISEPQKYWRGES